LVTVRKKPGVLVKLGRSVISDMAGTCSIF
jgi:hypothetical protein